MLKRLLCLIIISSLLYSDIAYPLSRSSFLQDSGFSEIVSVLANPDFRRDRSGVWLEGKNSKIRFFEPGKAVSPTLDKDDELIHEERIGDRLIIQVYFKGLDDEAKAAIRAFLFNNPQVSSLARVVLGGQPLPPHGRIVRREISRETGERLSGFISRLTPQPSYSAITDAVVREMDTEVDDKTKSALRDYLNVFTKRTRLREQRDKVLQDKDIFILKKLSELEGERIYKSVRKLFEKLIGEEKRLKIVPPNVIARIVARFEGIREQDVDPSSIISFTWGDTIYFNSDSRLSDFIIYILHEVAHLYEGDEKDARRMDKELIAVLKGIVNLLRDEKQDSIADVLEYEVLGYELDLHTARLQASNSGEAFLRHFYLASIDITAEEGAYLQVTGVIREKKDSDLFSEIRSIIKRGDKRLGMRLFWAFMKYVKRRIREKIEEEEELLKEEEEAAEPLEPLTQEDVLSYIITKDEAERRLKEVVLNPNAPLFARINDAIMIDIFSESKDIELGAVEVIRPILEKEPVKALQILEELRNARSVELISGFLRHKDPKVRGIAAKRLFNIARSLAPNEVFSSQKTIVNMLDFINRPKIDIKDEDLTAVLQVVKALSSIRCREAIPIFMDIIEKNKSNRIRLFVASALGSIGDTSVIPMIRGMGDVNSIIACLEQVPNDESARIVIDTFLKTSDKKIKLLCLKALEAMIRKRRISTSVMIPILEPLMKIKGFNFILGRVVSIALQEDRQVNVRGEALHSQDFAMGLIHDTFMNIGDLKGRLDGMLGKWAVLIEYMQRIRDDIYRGKREYTDIIWKEVAEKLASVKPEEDKPIGKMWFQRMCLAISYRALLDTWDIGRIEDRDFILELMILRTNFIAEDEMPEGAIGATEAMHGDYVELEDSLFSTPGDIPLGVNTAWHEATHLLSGMGIADISDISLLGASSHENIEFYLLSEIFGLPPIKDVVEGLKNGKTVKDLEELYVGKGLPREHFGGLKPVLEGMAVRDKAEGPLEAFFMVRNISPKKVRKWKWEDVLWKLQKINTEIVDTFTIRGRRQILVHTYLDGARFSGYAHRLGVETGFYDATNIYVELLVRARLRPSQAEFVTRVIARFMTEERDYIEKMKPKDVPAGETEKWLKRFIVERIKFLALKTSANIEMWITYEELDALIYIVYGRIKEEMYKTETRKEITDRAVRAVASRKRIFKAVRPGYRKDRETKIITHIYDNEGMARPVGIYKLENPRYLEITVDFGEGEESYAYVDLEDKKIRLVNPLDERIDTRQLEKAVEIELSRDDSLQINSPLEEKPIFSFKSFVKRIRGIDWRRFRKSVYYGLSLIGIAAIFSITGYFKSGLLAIIAAACTIIVFEFMKRQRILYEDVKVRLSKEQRRRLRENRMINKKIRRFRDDLKAYRLVTPRGDIFSIESFNRLFLTYDRDGAISVLIRTQKIDPKVSRRIVDWALKLLEYKEEITISDLDDMVLQPYIEKAIVRIINGGYVYPIIGRISPLADVRDIWRFKRIGLAECLGYAREGKDKLSNVLRNSFMVGYARRLRLSYYVAEPVMDIIYDVYLSSKDDVEFINRVVQLDITDYITPPSTRHRFVREFKVGGESSITTDDRVFDAVLDSMGINEGLRFLKKVKEETGDEELYWKIYAYIGSFEIGPTWYIPVVIEDAWRSFSLWKNRVGDVPYEDIQRRFIELYIRYIRNAKDDIPRIGWTMLWLCYFEKGSKMYEAVNDLLKGLGVDEICDKYKLTPDEKQKLLYSAPIDGFISLVQIYCRDIIWGKETLSELEERLKKDMNILTGEDVAEEKLFNSEVQSWFYTFRNIPAELQDKIRDKLRKEAIDLIMDVLINSGSTGCTREELEGLFDLIFATRLPASGYRFIDNASIIDISKILFDYARYRVKNDAAIKKLHSARNSQIKSGEFPISDERGLFFKGKRLLIFTNKQTETIGLLNWLKGILKKHPHLEIRIIPQKSMWEPNSTKEDIEALIKEMELDGSKVVVLDNCSPGISWLKGPEYTRVKEEVSKADALLGIGWDNFVSLQGLNRPCYFAFSVDDDIVAELTGFEVGASIFVKTCGGILASQIGRYSLIDYLKAINTSAYRELLKLFRMDEIGLHEWIVKEAKRTNRSEVDIMKAGISFEGLVECLLRSPDSEARTDAMGLLINNYSRFGIKKEKLDKMELDGVRIEFGQVLDCYLFPGGQTAILERDGKRLILEVFDKKFLRIGEKVYNVTGVVKLHDLATEPAFWIGNSEYVEFMGSSIMRGGEIPTVDVKDIPPEILAKIPQTKPAYVFVETIDPSLPLPLQLHYAVVLLSSPSLSQRIKGLEELERLRAKNDPEIMEIIRIKGLSRVSDWLHAEVPSVDRDIFSLTNFTPDQEKILQVLGGGYLLRPPLVVMPGQGVSKRFFDLLREGISRFDIELVRSNYAEGTGSILFQDGARRYVKEGDQIVEFSRWLSQGQMLGAIRLRKNGNRIVQVPTNAGLLNYLKVIHHLSHIFAERFKKRHAGEPDPLQEFTPTIEDILVIKYMERVASIAKDGFSDFKEEVRGTASEELLGLSDMAQFADYINKNNLGNFYSVKEFLNILIDYSKNAIRDYIEQLPASQKIILEGLLNVTSDMEINSLLVIASLLAGSHVPRVHFDRDIEEISNLLERPKLVSSADKDSILERINGILEGAEPFSAKAVKIVGTVLYRSKVRLDIEERRDIEEEVMDVLSGKWLQKLGELLRDRLRGLEIDTRDLRERLDEIERHMLGETQRLGKPEQVEVKGEGIDEIPSWDRIVDYVREHNIKRVFCDIDKTILDAPGFITTTPWFRELAAKEGEEETIRQWAELEEGVMRRGMVHLMEDGIPGIIKKLQDMGVEIILYTARRSEDLPRTQNMLKILGIEGLEIVTSKGGTPEAKRDSLIEYYVSKGWFDVEETPALYIDDTLSNLKAVHGDGRFSHIRCVWYHTPYKKRYDVDPEEFLAAGDKALRAGNIMEALEWYYNAFYIKSRKDIANQLYDIVMGHIGFEATIEDIFYSFIRNRFNRYGGAVEREKAWQEVPIAGIRETVQSRWIEGAPDIPMPGFWKGVKRIIVIGSHPHGDHIKGFLDYAKRRLRPLADTAVPEPYHMRTGGPITHTLANYWGRIGEETIVLFDLGWFPEGFVDPIIQTINPRDREIVFMMDPDTARTLDFERQLKRLKLEGVRFEPVSYGQPLNIPIESGQILQVENYPAYHLPKQVGSSVYILRVVDANTQEEMYSVGYINEIGDMFPEEIDDEFLTKLSRLDRIIVDGTNLFAQKGEEPQPIKGRPSKVPGYVKLLNRGKFLIAHLNTTSIKMLEEAEEAAVDLEPGVPIVVIGGKDAIDQLRRSYNVSKDVDYYTIGDKKVYLVNNVFEFHKKLRESGSLPKLEDVLAKRIEGLRKAGWAKGEIDEFVREWKEADGKEVAELEGPEGKARGLAHLFWDLRKTKAVVISSSQFRGDPTKDRYKNFKGFQLLDAIVDKKDVCILIEGRLHVEGEEGVVLKVLLGKRKDRYIDSITGRKKVRAFIDSQWRSGHITFRQLVYLLNLIADRSVTSGNVYNRRVYIPVPSDEWLGLVPDTEVQKYGKRSSRDVIDIINRWNDRKDVTIEEIHFVREVYKEIFKKLEFPLELRDGLLKRLGQAEEDTRLMARANNGVFIASTSKFLEVLRRQLGMDPTKLNELLGLASRFTGFEVGVSYEYGKTIDLVRRRIEEYSLDLEKRLNREYLKELYRLTVAGRIPADLSLYTEKKGIEIYRAELGTLLEHAKKRAGRKREEDPFNIWFGELKGYIESQLLRLGFRYAYKVVPQDELRKELSIFYDAIIEFVYNYIQEGKDIAIVAGGDYAIVKILFKDIVRLGILTGDGVEQRYVSRLQGRLKGVLNKLGIPVEFTDWPEFLNRRMVVSSSKEIEKELKLEVGKGVLVKRKARLESDSEILEQRKKKFDIHTGPGGLDDIELIRLFFGQALDSDDRLELDKAEEFLRRYKEEVGLSTGGDRLKARLLLGEIIGNLGLANEAEFNREFYNSVSKVFDILKKVLTKGRTKSLSFGKIDEERDIHGTFEKADMEGRLFTEDKPGKAEAYFRLIREIIKGYPQLEGRRYKIIEEEPGKPTMFYCEEPFSSVFSHGGRSTNTIYLGFNTLKLVKQRPEYRHALLQLILHENRDIERGYHLDDLGDADEVYRMWNDLITDGRFGIMYGLYQKRAREKRYWEYFLDRIPANIRIIKGKDLFSFEHGDHLDLADSIGLNLDLFRGSYSPDTQVFLLRHCTDRIRYDRYKTIINDIKYLTKMPKDERRRILNELRGLEYGIFLDYLLRLPLKEVKPRIRDYVGLRFKTYTSPDGANIWYSVGGNPNAKRTLVFLHGIGINSRDWRHQITFFEKDYRIIAVDLRGFGKSQGLGKWAPHIKNYAKDVEGILTQEGITDAILIGHSLGGIAALNMDELYVDTPLEKRRIKGLVLIASIAGNPTESFIFSGLKKISFEQFLRFFLFYISQFEFIWNNPFFKRFAKSPLIRPLVRKIFEALIIRRETHPLFTDKVIGSVFSNDLQDIIYGFRAIMTHNVEDRLKDLGIPVLWIIGRGDRMILPRAQREDAKKIRNCTVVEIPHAIHYPHATYPRHVNKEVYEFINKGEFRFLQLINEEFKLEISTDKLEGSELRLRERLRDAGEVDLRLIDHISRAVTAYGKLTGVSDDLMVKAVMAIVDKTLPRQRVEIPPAGPLPVEDTVEYIRRSV